MAMVFTLVSAVQERLTTLVEETRQHRQEEAERRLKAEEEIEQVLYMNHLLSLINVEHSSLALLGLAKPTRMWACQ